MNASEIRQAFFDFFESKGHKIVPSAPIVVKDDPTLMFTNAGMNQFKDLFLGNKEAQYKKIADTQKCLRVSGKHNDLEEVGIDSYHHTMFEMLGNWSIGDYFKEEAIAWAWELLTEVYKLPKDRLYVTVFGGDTDEGLKLDREASDIWAKWIDPKRILPCGKKDNFWEMGDVGPCGPCSEIHVDLRSDEDRKALDGLLLVNEDHPQVVEIWNLVFIQYNRKSDGSLESLPDQHIDTGMGFERLCMAMQGKMSNYDTDIFRPFITTLEKETGIKYTGRYDLSAKSDIAMRVIADHIRAVSFTIADGEMPSNTGAGYVIRRILRRAVRYYFTFLDTKEPLLHKLIPQLAAYFKDVFPELEAQVGFVTKVILEEEKSFLRTLELGLKRMESLEVVDNVVSGISAFELYDTYGFPIDLTRLIASEKNWTLDEAGFEKAINEQKERSRSVAQRSTGDWVELIDGSDVQFEGYDNTALEGVKIIKYREVTEKSNKIYQVVLDKTPFYAEGGGQIGDTGFLTFDGEVIKVLDTKKENDLIIHYVDRFPENTGAQGIAQIDVDRRSLIENNHTATHLMHAALREVLGDHVQQRGSSVRPESLRFDFSHFSKMTDEEILNVEKIVNHRIRENISLKEDRMIPIEIAKESGATMLFGEKYGEHVRMITFNDQYSIELCGGCHVKATGQIGLFKIKSEAAVASGVRRIEAVTALVAEQYIQAKMEELQTVQNLFKSPLPVTQQVESLQEENKNLKKEIDELMVLKAAAMKKDLIASLTVVNGVKLITQVISLTDAKVAKNLAYSIENELGNAVILFGMEDLGKPQLMLTISEQVAKDKGYHAGNMIRELAKNIKGGGGGQAFFATAGGQDASGLKKAIDQMEKLM